MKKFDMEDFGNFINEQAKKLDLFIRVGKMVCEVHSIDDFDKGENHVFGFWNCNILTGITLTDKQLETLQTVGEVHNVVDMDDSGVMFTIKKITKEECEASWNDVKKVPDHGSIFMHKGKTLEVGDSAMFMLAGDKIEMSYQPDPKVNKWVNVPFESIQSSFSMSN